MLKLSKRKNRKGVTITEIMLVLIIIGILCAMAVPNFTRMRANAYRDKCITNLRIIVSAKEHWSLETGAADTATPTAAQLNPYIKDGTSSLVCPLDPDETFASSYTIKPIKYRPECKIKPGTHYLSDFPAEP